MSPRARLTSPPCLGRSSSNMNSAISQLGLDLAACLGRTITNVKSLKQQASLPWETTRRGRRRRVNTPKREHAGAEAPARRHWQGPSSQSVLVVTVVCYSLVMLPWDGNYGALAALLLGAFMVWCALDVLAAHSPQHTRVRARGTHGCEHEAMHGQCNTEFVQNWALLHADWSPLGDHGYSPY